MTEIEKEEIKQQIYFEWYKTGEAKKIIDIIKKANREIAKEIKQTDIVYTKSRYNDIKKVLDNIVKDVQEKITETIPVEDVINYELKKEKKILNRGTDKINVDFILPSLEQIKTSALFKPIVPSLTYKNYLDGISKDLFNQWDTAVRTGYMTNETTKNIVYKVLGKVSPAELVDKGTMQTLYNSVYRNTRTALQSFANETRRSIYSKNKDIIEKVKYLATLDRRTCLICGKLDGKIFTLKDAPVLPIHYNCRCVEIPIIKGADVTENERPTETGTTKGTVTYKDWLKEQSQEVQKEILGDARYKMFKEGLPINEFTENNKILSINELNNRI